MAAPRSRRLRTRSSSGQRACPSIRSATAYPRLIYRRPHGTSLPRRPTRIHSSRSRSSTRRPTGLVSSVRSLICQRLRAYSAGRTCRLHSTACMASPGRTRTRSLERSSACRRAACTIARLRSTLSWNSNLQILKDLA